MALGFLLVSNGSLLGSSLELLAIVWSRASRKRSRTRRVLPDGWLRLGFHWPPMSCSGWADERRWSPASLKWKFVRRRYVKGLFLCIAFSVFTILDGFWMMDVPSLCSWPEYKVLGASVGVIG
ncbi:uncharacterized protein LOC132279600 [Cornus florida]|uniref:uncharacterized protein LOC132279600 n=1 Tax=Cornus florida TaxID=4283 RepID=UPI00289A8AE1|nr:uncharacterized protein LOC132279600 [Cornus florida]